MFRIATLADWFGVGLLEGIRESERCGASGVQLYAWNELNPFEITKEKIAEVRRVADGCGQMVTALCGELSEVMPGHGLEIREDNPVSYTHLGDFCSGRSGRLLARIANHGDAARTAGAALSARIVGRVNHAA